MKILRIDSSGRHNGSVSRQLTGLLLDRFVEEDDSVAVVERDLANSFVPFVNDLMIGGYYISDDQRSTEQKDALKTSDGLVEELKAADVIIFGIPIYNFGIPAVFKAYLDLVCRAGLTFKYSEEGPKGTLENKKAFVIISSGGTEVGSDIDFSSGYLKHVLAFIGITDVTVVAADKLLFDGEQKIAKAKEQIHNLTLK